MSKRRLPPLNSVRAFEAAARLQSFSLAAEELHVTPSAISQQVKTLEEWLGFELFRRQARGLVLSEKARPCLPRLVAALDQIDDAFRALAERARTPTLTISTTASFATQWLVPRLRTFYARNPDVDVRVSAADRMVDLHSEEFDLAIRHGAGRYPGLRVECLIEERFAPVCAPALAYGERPIRTAADLRPHRLLHMQPDGEDAFAAYGWETWEQWFAAAGVEPPELSRGSRFSDKYLAILEAIAGSGITLGPWSLIQEELRAGRLVAPIDLWLPANANYYLVYTDRALENPALEAFREWILEAAAAMDSP
ncbi:MAG: transcriptional regulator GcvA [Ectothiorhodospiraceae bacterium]|jgi:LysR family glycine cleavage system transcriptional activator